MILSDVTQELANAVSAGVVSTPKLEAFGYMPDTIPEPAFVIGDVEIEPNNAFGPGFDVALITCLVLVGRVDSQDSRKVLDGYLSRTGAASVRAAILAAGGTPTQPALSGKADDLKIEAVRGYRHYEFGDYRYFGGEIVVMVLGS